MPAFSSATPQTPSITAKPWQADSSQVFNVIFLLNNLFYKNSNVITKQRSSNFIICTVESKPIFNAILWNL